MLHSKLSASILLLLGISSTIADPTVHSNIRMAHHNNGRAVHSNMRVVNHKHHDRAVQPDVKVVVGLPEVAIHEMMKRSDDEIEEDLDADEHFGQISARQSTSDASQALSLHNSARTKKYIPSLTWDTALEASALAYAKTLASSGKFAHSDASTRPNQGENLAYAWSSSGNVLNPITTGTNGWLNESSMYKGEAIPMGNFTGYGHYTQIMWNTTAKVGIATASNGKGAWYTVARYSPPGNYGGQKPF